MHVMTAYIWVDYKNCPPWWLFKSLIWCDDWEVACLPVYPALECFLSRFPWTLVYMNMFCYVLLFYCVVAGFAFVFMLLSSLPAAFSLSSPFASTSQHHLLISHFSPFCFICFLSYSYFFCNFEFPVMLIMQKFCSACATGSVHARPSALPPSTWAHMSAKWPSIISPNL